MSPNKIALFHIFLLLTLHTLVLNSQNTRCNSRDLIVLKDFLKGLDSWNLDWDHASTDCCMWTGVKCENSSDLGVTSSGVSGQRVVRLNLGNKNLKGRVLKSLAGLDQLQVLNLSSNALSGVLAPELFNLQHLKVLDLSGNKFSGSIPASAILSTLEVFDISNNSFTGSHPLFPTHQSLNLTKFVLSKNLFTGPIDAVSLCTSLPRIEFLDFSSNRFSGSIPHGFGHCKSMTYLFLNSNLLSGSLPDDLFELSSLSQLDLHGNELFGQLDERVQNLSNLFHLDISNNGFYGNIPEIFTGLRNLVHFSARSNNFTGPLPVTLSSAPMLSHLSLRNNSLQGTIDINCSQLANLNFLDLSSNLFTGTIPEQLSLCTGLQCINFDRNKLEGLIPESLKRITDLSYLSLSNNGFRNISRTLDILQQCERLSTLVLAGNFQGEEMPIKQIEGFSNLKVLSIPNCSLHGRIPPWLSNCTQLKVLDFSRNRLTGRIPSLLGGLPFLSYLNLSHNQLTGELPTNITVHSQRRLLSHYWLMKLHGLPVPYTARNQLTEDLQYNQFLNLPPSIDLSKNQLVGPIPAELGDLKDLIILDLSWNHLSTTIPENLSNLLNLEILDLSNNNLTGRIPSSFARLNFLSWFNVANNRLEGEIPTGGQFSTFPNSSFEGNLALCGDYFRPCVSSPPVPLPSDDSRVAFAFDRFAFGLGSAIGFITTVIVCMLSGFCYGRDKKVIELKLLACTYVASCLGRGNKGGGRVSASASST